jgi:hypothetical protein
MSLAGRYYVHPLTNKDVVMTPWYRPTPAQIRALLVALALLIGFVSCTYYVYNL